MNPDYILEKRAQLKIIINYFAYIRDEVNAKMTIAWDNNDDVSFFDILMPIYEKLSQSINELILARANLHLQEYVDLVNHYLPPVSVPETVQFVLDKDDAYMEEKYGEE